MTLVWAAVISIATTLAMEWFAKPWLEVRKDRILDQRRNLRKLQLLADGGVEVIASLHDKEFHHSHPNQGANALRQYRVELATLKYGLSSQDRKRAEALAKVSNSFAKDSTHQGWMETYDDCMHAFAIFRYGRNEERAHTRLIERGLFKDDGDGSEI
jgi:hypothetical protein